MNINEIYGKYFVKDGPIRGRNFALAVYRVDKMIDPEYCWMNVHHLFEWYRWCRNQPLTVIDMCET